MGFLILQVFFFLLFAGISFSLIVFYALFFPVCQKGLTRFQNFRRILNQKFIWLLVVGPAIAVFSIPFLGTFFVHFHILRSSKVEVHEDSGMSGPRMIERIAFSSTDKNDISQISKKIRVDFVFPHFLSAISTPHWNCDIIFSNLNGETVSIHRSSYTGFSTSFGNSFFPFSLGYSETSTKLLGEYFSEKGATFQFAEF